MKLRANHINDVVTEVDSTIETESPRRCGPPCVHLVVVRPRAWRIPNSRCTRPPGDRSEFLSFGVLNQGVLRELSTSFNFQLSTSFNFQGLTTGNPFQLLTLSSILCFLNGFQAFSISRSSVAGTRLRAQVGFHTREDHLQITSTRNHHLQSCRWGISVRNDQHSLQ